MNLRKCIVLAVAASLGSTAALAGDADFTIVNKTGYNIREVYVSPSKKDNWGRDRLGENATLDNNKQRLLKFSDRASCKQDLKVVFDDDDSEVTWPELDLCEINKLTLKYNRASKQVSAIKE